MRFAENDFAEIFRLSYTGKIENRSSLGTIQGFLKPASSEVSLINNIQSGQAFVFLVKYTPDIQVTDVLIVDSVEYNAKGVKNNPTSVGYTEIVLQRAVTS